MSEYIREWQAIKQAHTQVKLAKRLAEVAEKLEEQIGPKAAKELLGGVNLASLKTGRASGQEMSQAVDALARASQAVKSAAFIGGALPKQGVSQNSGKAAVKEVSPGKRYRDSFGRVREEQDIPSPPPIRKPPRAQSTGGEGRDAQGRRLRDDDFQKEQKEKLQADRRRATGRSS